MTKPIFNTVITIFGGIAIYASYMEARGLFWALKPLTSILVFCLTLFFKNDLPIHARSYRIIIIAALIFCLLGDVFLLDDAFFVFGLSSFLVAHLLFAYVFYKLADSRPHVLALLICVTITLAYFSLLKPHLGELLIPVAIYISCIVFMWWQSIRVFLSRRDSVGLTIAIAATLFVISDSIIAANKFLTPLDASNALILSLYWASITLIANVFSGRRPQKHSN